MGVPVAEILVTGAAGFIGGTAVRQLADHGLPALGATRDGKDGTRRLDLREPASFGPALAGIKAIVHCAVGDRAVIVDGFGALLRAAAEAGVERVVQLSTMSVYAPGEGVITEDHPLLSASGEGYGHWKVAAEELCEAETRLATVRLRPTIVYGAGGAWWLGHMARRIRTGRWATLGAAGEGTCNLVHVDDVVSAIAAALKTPEAAGRAYNVNGPELITWNAYFRKLAEIVGTAPLRDIGPLRLRTRVYGAVPLRVLNKFVPALGRDRLLGIPGMGELGLFAGHTEYLVERARRELGWTPVVGVDEGLARSMDWLRGERLVA